MDVVITENVKVPNSLLVMGLSDTEADEEIVDFLKQYGSIERVLKVDSSDPKFQIAAIIEFQSWAAIQGFKKTAAIKQANLCQSKCCMSHSAFV